jgi:hypothetical protein
MYKYILVVPSTYFDIPVYTLCECVHSGARLRTKEYEKLCITLGFDLMHTVRLFRPLYHERLSQFMQFTRSAWYKTIFFLLRRHVTWRLVSDVRRGPRRAPRAGHDVAGPDLHLDLLEAGSPGPPHGTV